MRGISGGVGWFVPLDLGEWDGGRGDGEWEGRGGEGIYRKI